MVENRLLVFCNTQFLMKSSLADSGNDFISLKSIDSQKHRVLQAIQCRAENFSV